MPGKTEIDIVEKILDACYRSAQFPLFIMSLMHQYEERGSLSKKQLQGLYYKAEKVPDIPANWLATLQAKISRMPNRFKQEKEVQTKAVAEEDSRPAELAESILQKYPQHKRVLFLSGKIKNNELLSSSEITELERFAKLLLSR